MNSNIPSSPSYKYKIAYVLDPEVKHDSQRQEEYGLFCRSLRFDWLFSVGVDVRRIPNWHIKVEYADCL